MSLSSAEIHAEQQQRNLARFGTETFPGGRGDWPDFPDMIAPPPNIRVDDLPDTRGATPTAVFIDEEPIDDYPLWEG
jgi:hypothetical protein